MIKALVAAVCDYCGKIEEAKHTTMYRNEDSYVIPDGWAASPVNENVHFCDVCSRRISRDIVQSAKTSRNNS